VADQGRILALDYGTKRVGLALSDRLQILASGAGTLENGPGLIDVLRQIIERELVVWVVVGMPYAPDGGLGAKGVEVEMFVRELRRAISVPVHTWDESHSSRDAVRTMIGSGVKRKKRRQKARVDEMAARLFLQEYLDNQPDRRGS
jgi:putative Holliday junction resolvase